MALLVRKTVEQEAAEWSARLHDDIRAKRINLPVLPEITKKLRDVVQDSNAPIKLVTSTLSAEPALVAKILKAGSSSFLGMEPTRSLDSAIVRLGFNAVRGMVFNYCLSKLFKERQSGPLKDELRKVWQRATLTGLFAQMLASRLKHENSYALLAGLIHNVGTLPVLAMFTQHRELAGKLDLMRLLMAKEKAVLGELVAQSWSLPLDVTQIPLHLEHEAYQNTLLDIVRCAVKLAEWYESPGFTVEGVARLPAAQRLKIDGAILAVWVADARTQVSDMAHLLTD